MLEMEGSNLAEKCCQQILMHPTETPLDKIQKIDNLHFKMQSSNTNQYYNIDLVTTTCDRSDFPCIRLCKHIAGIVHFFGGADLEPQPPDNRDGTSKSSKSVASKSSTQKDDSTVNDTASFISMANFIIA